MAESSAHRLPRAFWALIAGMFVNRAGGFVVPFLALYLKNEQAMGTGAKGAVLAAWGTGTVLAGLVGGRLADKLGRKPTMLLGLCGGAAVLAALAFAHGVGAWVPLALAFGAVAELYRPAVMAAIADFAPPAERARAFAYLTWSYNLGFAVSPVVAGYLIEHHGYRWLFAGDAATMLLAALVIFLWVPETRPVATREAAADSQLRGTSPWLDPRFQPLLATAFLTGLVIIQAAASLALVFERSGIGAGAYGRTIALNGLLIALTQPWLVPRLERLGRVRVLPWASGLFGIGFALHALAQSQAAHAATIVVWTLGEVALFPLCNACVADCAPEARRGRYQGAFWMAIACANIAGPPLGLWALEDGVHRWGLVLALAGAGATFAASRYRPRGRD